MYLCPKMGSMKLELELVADPNDPIVQPSPTPLPGASPEVLAKLFNEINSLIIGVFEMFKLNAIL
jgi:hypothetical protein